jgi:Uma2 family endonuclease
MGFRLSEKPRVVREPDLAFVKGDRWTPDIVKPGDAWNTVPNLAVEFVSPSDEAEELQEKIQDLLAAGVQAVWVFYSGRHPQVHCYDGPTSVRVFGPDEEIDAAPVLPGFKFRFADLLAALSSPT